MEDEVLVLIDGRAFFVGLAYSGPTPTQDWIDRVRAVRRGESARTLAMSFRMREVPIAAKVEPGEAV